MILLMGMKINLTKNPTKPMTTKPIAVRVATLVNSTTAETKSAKTKRRGNGSVVLCGWRSGTFAIGLVATLDEADAVLGEISERIEN